MNHNVSFGIGCFHFGIDKEVPLVKSRKFCTFLHARLFIRRAPSAPPAERSAAVRVMSRYCRPLSHSSLCSMHRAPSPIVNRRRGSGKSGSPACVASVPGSAAPSRSSCESVADARAGRRDRRNRLRSLLPMSARLPDGCPPAISDLVRDHPRLRRRRRREEHPQIGGEIGALTRPTIPRRLRW